MRLLAFIVFVSVMLLATCSAPELAPALFEREVPSLSAESPLPTHTVQPPAPTEAAPSPKLSEPSFKPQTYFNESAGFALDYPAGWTVREVAVGPRGTQVQFLSAPEVAEMPVLPEGATRLNATIYRWEPKNDLAAFVANQKTAWEASGITIHEEAELVLELGLPGVMFSVEAPDADLIFLMVALEDQYLVLSGEGDLELVQEIVQRVRPIS